MQHIRKKTEETLRFLRKKHAHIPIPKMAVVLGTGMHIDLKGRILWEESYENLPNFPKSTSPSHAGKLAIMNVAGINVLVFMGRFHYYEGYSMCEVTYPVRFASALGANTIILTNAAGGLNPDFCLSDVIAVSDHINLMGDSPLIGLEEETPGARWVDMLNAYDKDLRKIFIECALDAGVKVKEGILAALPGPQLETPAEYKMLQILGADLITLSTIPEVIAARHASMRVITASAVTDMCLQDSIKPVNVNNIIAAGQQAAVKLSTFFKDFLLRIQ